MNDEGLRDALDVFGKEYIAELSNRLRKLDKKATGKLLQSLDSRVIKTAFGTIYTIDIRAEKYLKYVDSGRRPGTYPPLKAISDWAKVKGISQRAVFPIMKKIKDKGIKPTNVIQKSLKAVQQGRAINQFEDDVADWTDDLINDLIFDISKKNNITVKRG